jgi:hypothetical protein
VQGAITHLIAGVPVSDLDLGIEHEPVDTYSNGVRHTKIPDPDGNAIAFAEPPDATA